MKKNPLLHKPEHQAWTRRRFLKSIAAGGIALTGGGLTLFNYLRKKERHAETFIGSVADYSPNVSDIIMRGFKEIGITEREIRGKRVLLKPNLVEPHSGLDHINTHPVLIRAAAETFLHLGAAKIIVAEGAGHRRDSLLVLEESGLADMLHEDRIPFIDLNTEPVIEVENLGGASKLKTLMMPRELLRADLIVSIAKMKTHHWTGVTLSMKNMFGVMPGIVYGWPKNVLHWAGVNGSIYDINATVKPHLAIVDGIVGMEGDGPIMGTPVKADVLIIGRNLPAVDATCARIMGVNPLMIPYLKGSSGLLGTIGEPNIEQRGESIASVRKDFKLLDFIPAHKGLRL